MWCYTALLVGLVTALSHVTSGMDTLSLDGSEIVLGISGDDTRHGVMIGSGRPAGWAEVQIMHFYVNTLIQSRFARTVVDVSVKNHQQSIEEIVVPFVIPENAMLVGFEIEVDGKIFKAHPATRETASFISASAGGVVSARDAVSFDMKLELQARSTVKLRLTYEELLTRHLGVYKNVQQVWPRMVVVDMQLSVHIREPSAIVTSAKHAFTSESAGTSGVVSMSTESLVVEDVVTRDASGNVTEVKYIFRPTIEDQQNIARDLDLIGEEEAGLAGQWVVEYEVERYDVAGEMVLRDGYFAHFFAPTGLQSLPKYVIFVLDVSGSMAGRKIQQLREAMKTILDKLQPEDYFSVIEYCNGAVAWDMIWENKRPDKCDAFSSKFVENAERMAPLMDPYGGTDMLAGLNLAFNCLSDMPKGLEPIMVMLTDGQPDSSTSEVLDATRNLNHVNQANPDDLNVSLFTLALGYDADISFLTELAVNNGGSARQIYEASDASKQLEDFYLTIATPKLTDVSFEFTYDEADQESLTRNGFRTYFEGSELVVAGKLLSSDVNQISGVVTGFGRNGQTISFPFNVSTSPLWQPETLAGQPNSERLWAFLKTSQLIDSALLDGVEDIATNATIALALPYSFVTPYTCLVMDIGEDYAETSTAAPSSPPQQSPTEITTAAAIGTTWSAPSSTPAPPCGQPSTTGGQPEADQPTASPGQPTAAPGQPTATPGQPTATPGQPTATLGQPTVTPGQPTATPGQPTATPGQPTATPGQPTVTPGQPTATPGQPTTPGRPHPTSGQPTATPGRPHPTTGRPYPTTGRPHTTTGRPYPSTGRPHSTPGRPTPEHPATSGKPTPPGRPTPPGPPGSSRPPRPADRRIVSGQIDIGQLAIKSLSFNGPLLQFNFR